MVAPPAVTAGATAQGASANDQRQESGQEGARQLFRRGVPRLGERGSRLGARDVDDERVRRGTPLPPRKMARTDSSQSARAPRP